MRVVGKRGKPKQGGGSHLKGRGGSSPPNLSSNPKKKREGDFLHGNERASNEGGVVCLIGKREGGELR